MQIQVEVAVAGAPGRPCQDSARARLTGDELVCALADGVGGMGGGEEASRWVVEQWLNQPEEAVEALLDYDDRLSRRPQGGQSTAVLLRLSARGLEGASVGDSRAWLLNSKVEMTERQHRKPYLGSGEALPVGFAFGPLPPDRLLLASDGLWKAIPLEKMLELAGTPDLKSALAALLQAARLPLSGEYADDVSIILVDFVFGPST